MSQRIPLATGVSRNLTLRGSNGGEVWVDSAYLGGGARIAVLETVAHRDTEYFIWVSDSNLRL